MKLFLTKDQRNDGNVENTLNHYWSDNYTTDWNCNPTIEVVNDKENLVICYGDSWTWGDSLGNTNVGNPPDRIDDVEFRTQNVYGAKLAEKLNADFINQAYPGIYNFWIHNRLKILLDHDIQRLSSQYKNVFIVVTLTESGRDFACEYYLPEFKKFYNWNNGSAEEIIVEIEKFDFFNLKNIQSQLPTNCKLFVGRNFTNTFDQNQNTVDNLLPKNWTQILFDHQGLESLDNVFMMSFGVDYFDNFIKSQSLDTLEYKKWMTEIIYPASKKQILLLQKSQYNYKKATKHPTPYGHQLWADYLFDYITQRQ